MTLNSKTIVDLAVSHGPGTRGRVEALRRQSQGRFGQAATYATPEIQRLLADVEANAGGNRETYQHPAQAPGAGVDRQRIGDREAGLTASEITWLQRIPSDVTKVSYADAVELAKLAAGIDRGKNPADARLIDSVWNPVKEFHDRGAAHVALRNASQPIPDVPSSALPALARAVAQETPQLRPEEALQRASEMLKEAAQARSQAQEMKIHEAREQLLAVDTAEQGRTAVFH